MYYTNRFKQKYITLSSIVTYVIILTTADIKYWAAEQIWLFCLKKLASIFFLNCSANI